MARLSCVAITAILLYCAYVRYQKRSSLDYQTGRVLGSSSYTLAAIRNLDCLGLQIQSLQTRDPSPNCSVEDLDGDSAIREAIKSRLVPGTGADASEGFVDGWREEARKDKGSK